MWKRLKIPTAPSHRCTNGFSELRIQVLTVSQGLQQTLPLRIRLLLSYWYQWMTLFVFDWRGSFLEYPETWMITNKIGWIMICQNINIYTHIYIYTRICIIVFTCFQAYLLISYTYKPVLLTCPSEDFFFGHRCAEGIFASIITPCNEKSGDPFLAFVSFWWPIF